MNLVIIFCPSRLRFHVQPSADAECHARHRWQAHWLTNGCEPPQLVGFADSPSEALERIAAHRADEVRCGHKPLPVAVIELQLFEEEGARHAAD